MKTATIAFSLFITTNVFAFGGLGGLGSLGSVNIQGGHDVKVEKPKKKKMAKKKKAKDKKIKLAAN